MFKKMFEKHNAIMLLIEADSGLILDANQSAVFFYGYDKAQLCAMKIDDINTWSPDKVLAERIKALKEERNCFIFQHRLANGEIRTVEVHSSPIDFNEDRMLFSIIHDITDRQKAELALLESEKQQKDINATKDKLFSIISHDLRSPFNSVLGLSELLASNIESQNLEEIEAIARMISTSSKSALVLLDNLLEWARLQTGQLKFQPEFLKLKPIIEEVFQMLRSAAEIKNISLTFDLSEAITVYAEENMQKTILRNLISNGIKFTQTHGQIQILARNHQNLVEISVMDNGVGMTEDMQDKLFQMEKYKSTKGTANEEGSGLGLLLCKEFVDRHGGRIWVESELEKGSEFKFTLPFPES